MDDIVRIECAKCHCRDIELKRESYRVEDGKFIEFKEFDCRRCGSRTRVEFVPRKAVI